MESLLEALLAHPGMDEAGLDFGAPPPGSAVAHAVMGPEGSKLALYAAALPGMYARALEAPMSDASSVVLVLCNPEHHSAWAFRKRLLVSKESTLAIEIHLCELALTRLPKSQFAFEHLAWLFNRAVRAATTKLGRDAVVREILGVCTSLATRHRRLYYAWVLRRQVCEWLNAEDFAAEMEFCHDWMARHVSDASCASFMGQLLCLWFDRDPSLTLDLTKRGAVLASETEWVASLILVYPHHEALWYYRRCLLGCWLTIASRLREGHSPEQIRSAFETVDVNAPKFPNRRWWWCESDIAAKLALEACLQVLLDEMNVFVEHGDVWAHRFCQHVALAVLQLIHGAEVEVHIADPEHARQLPSLAKRAIISMRE